MADPHDQESDAEPRVEKMNEQQLRPGGLLQAGFVLTGFYEDRYSAFDNDPLSQYLDTFIATRACKRSEVG